jgi:membrane fusion protein (multidrug efflux system)
VPVGTRVAGAVARVNIHENQQVKKGDLLVDIDRADFAARLRQAEAELATAQAQATAADAQVQIIEATSKGGFASARAALAGSTVGVSGADAQLAMARAAVARAESDARKAGIDLSRAQELRRANAVPQERLDGAQAAYDSSRAALAQAQAQVSFAEEAKRTAQSRVGEARGRVSQSAPIAPQIAAARAGADLAKARVQSAEAALALAKLQLDYTRVLAPADGVASKLMVHDGQLVGVGQPLVELVPTATYVLANFKETQIGRMRPGQHAEIRLDAFPGRKLDGRIESLAGGTGASFSLLPADNATGNFVKVVQRVPVRIAWTNPPADIALRAGLSAEVTVSVDQ